MAYGNNIPQLINYNGILADTHGNSVIDGNYLITFNIYDSPTEGILLWTETWNENTTKVVVSGGNFNVMLGTHNPILPSFFADHPATYLGITVGTDSELLPRQQITSVGYAFNAGNGVPKGGIIMWSGAIEDIPEGWALCDGNNKTPDLIDRFIIGAGKSYAVDKTGGEANHTLTISEMPEHNHSATSSNDTHNHAVSLENGRAQSTDSTNSDRKAWNSNGPGTLQADKKYIADDTHNHTITIENSGSGEAHNNLPPFYALCFIMKL